MISDLRQEAMQLLRRRGLDVEESVRFDWLTSKTPIEPGSEIPAQLKYRLIALHKKLGGDWSRLPRKRLQYLRIDLKVGESTLIELDTLQHFSSARLTTLDMYDGLDHSLDIDAYRQLCLQYREEADKYQRTREAPDFPFEGGRTAQTAYFDAAKDLIPAAFGYRLIRIPLPEGELTEAAKLALRVLV